MEYKYLLIKNQQQKPINKFSIDGIIFYLNFLFKNGLA